MRLAKTVVNNIRRLQTERDIKTADIADALYCSQYRAYYLTRGASRVTVDDIELLCEAYGVPYTYFFEECEEYEPYVRKGHTD